jgi:hypothetical protein
MKVVTFVLAALTGLAAPAIVAASTSPAATAAGPDSTTVSAVWVETKVNFPFRGLTSYYSCGGIENKVGRILKAIGARPGFKVQARSCVNYPGVELMPWVYITAALPQPATPELLAELAKPDSKRELVSLVNGTGTPAPEAAAQFPARWQRVTLQGTALGPTQPGDCELVEQMTDEVFKQLGARIIDDRTSCVPRQVSPGSIQLTLEVLQPVPRD